MFALPKKKNVPHYLNKTNCSLLFRLYYVFRLSSLLVYVFHGSTAIRYAVCSPFRLKLRIDKLLGMQIQMVYGGVAQLMMQLPMAFSIHFCLFGWGRVFPTTFNDSD